MEKKTIKKLSKWEQIIFYLNSTLNYEKEIKSNIYDYCISKEWIEKWKKYVGYKYVSELQDLSTNQPSDYQNYCSNEHPGKIINKILIKDLNTYLNTNDINDPENILLNENNNWEFQSENSRYFIIYQNVWNMFKENYEYDIEIIKQTKESTVVFYDKQENKLLEHFQFSYLNKEKIFIRIIKIITQGIKSDKIPKKLGLINNKDIYETNENLESIENYIKKNELEKKVFPIGKIKIDNPIFIYFINNNIKKEDINSENYNIIFHKPKYIYLNSENFINKSYELEKLNGRRGITNIGNTCFMNSVFQCLSNIFPLTKFFLEGEYKNKLNLDNPEGSEGKVLKEYVKLLEKLWIPNNLEEIFPKDLKEEIGNNNQLYQSYSQQDASQFLLYLLDVLNEDMNQGIQITNNNDIYNMSFIEQWDLFNKRNKSIIIDLFYGMFENINECCICHNIRKTYDPFNLIQLALHKPEFIFDDEEEKFKKENYIIDCYIVNGMKNSNTLKIEFPISIKEYNKKKIKDILDILNNNLCITNLICVFEEKIINEDAFLKNTFKNKKYLYFIQCNEEIYNSNDLFLKINLNWNRIRDEILNSKIILNEKINIIISNYVYKNNSINKIGTEIGFVFNIENDLSEIYKRVIDYYSLDLNIKKNEFDLKNNFLIFENEFEKNQLNKFLKFNFIFIIGIKQSKINKENLINSIIVPNIKISLNYYLEQIKIEKSKNLQFFIIWNDNIKFQLSSLDNISNNLIIDFMKKPEEKKGELSLDKCLSYFITKEYFKEQLSFYCNFCNKSTNYIKETKIIKSPKYLFFHFLRTHNLQKDDRNILFTFENFNLDKYMSKEKSKNNNIYNLIGIIFHIGGVGMMGGHYYAACKNYIDSKWYLFQDEGCEQVSDLKKLELDKAYCLLYEKIN